MCVCPQCIYTFIHIKITWILRGTTDSLLTRVATEKKRRTDSSRFTDSVDWCVHVSCMHRSIHEANLLRSQWWTSQLGYANVHNDYYDQLYEHWTLYKVDRGRRRDRESYLLFSTQYSPPQRRADVVKGDLRVTACRSCVWFSYYVTCKGTTTYDLQTLATCVGTNVNHLFTSIFYFHLDLHWFVFIFFTKN